MKRFLLVIICITATTNSLQSQDKHVLGLGLDLSFGSHYYSSEINNPLFLALNANYKFYFLKYFSVGAGFKAGGFQQSMSAGVEEYKRHFDVYKGSVYSPFITLGLYYDVIYNSDIDASHYIFIENRLSYHIMQLSKYIPPIDNTSKETLDYDIKMGYQYPISNKWSLSFFIGYSTYDYSKIDSENIKIKSSTPIQLGIGTNFHLK